MELWSNLVAERLGSASSMMFDVTVKRMRQGREYRRSAAAPSRERGERSAARVGANRKSPTWAVTVLSWLVDRCSLYWVADPAAWVAVVA